MSTQFRLPDGTYIRDCVKFSGEWDRLRKPIESLGFRVIAFDPGIVLRDEKTNGGSFELPLYAAKRFIDAMSLEKSKFMDNREAVARAICMACEENPDHAGDCRGNERRWQDYLPCADAAVAALSPEGGEDVSVQTVSEGSTDPGSGTGAFGFGRCEAEYRHLLGKARDAKLGGREAWAVQSAGEKVAVALVLNRPDWLSEIDYTLAEAIERAGQEWIALVPRVARELADE